MSAEDVVRCSKISMRYNSWLEAHNKAEKHARGCKQCKLVDDGETLVRVSCPQAPPFPPIDNFEDLR